MFLISVVAVPRFVLAGLHKEGRMASANGEKTQKAEGGEKVEV